MRTLLLLLISLSITICSSQTVADFENLYPGEESFNLGLGADGFFRSGNLAFPNSYDPEFMSFSGWAISSTTDTETQGFTNQSSAITGGGNEGSASYSFTYAFDPVRVIPEDEATGGTMDGLYVTNSTYAYFSMLNGDQFAKRFGGVDGTDPDFFLLTIEGYEDGALKEAKVEFYLADYRFEDESEDYILDEWTWVDLKTLGNVDSLEFSLSSSDNGDFGMNTPAYFCIDDFISLDQITNNREISRSELSLFPNPSVDILKINSRDPMRFVQVFSLSGQVVTREEIPSQKTYKLNTTNWNSGIYMVSVTTNNGEVTQRVVKH